MSTKSADKVGRRYGRLVVSAIIGKDRYGARFSCRCDCGEETEVSNCNLGRNTFSCGCFNRDQIASKQVWEVEFRREQLNSKNRRKHTPWTISFDEFSDLVQKACHYCGQAPSRKTVVGNERRNGIDRVDNLKGTPSRIVSRPVGGATA